MAKVVLQIWEQVSAMGQKDLPCLKDKLGNWGPPARNTVILRQFDQLKVTCIRHPQSALHTVHRMAE